MYNCTCTTKTSVYSTIHTTITLEDIFFIPHIYKGMFETMILKIREKAIKKLLLVCYLTESIYYIDIVFVRLLC
jgi:hypothetical protein